MAIKIYSKLFGSSSVLVIENTINKISENITAGRVSWDDDDNTISIKGVDNHHYFNGADNILVTDVLDVNDVNYTNLESFLNIVVQHLNLQPTPSDFMLEVSKGTIANTFSVNKFGSNANITKNTREDVWGGGGDYPYSATPTITSLSQKIDQVSMRGADIEIQGLDSNWDLITQIVPLNELNTTTIEILPTPLLRVFRMKINANIIGNQIISVHNATNTIDYAIITPDYNQTLMALYTVPSGHTAYLVKAYGDVVESTGKEPKSTEFNLWVKDNVNDYAFQLKSARGVPKAGAAIVGEFDPYMRIKEKSDIKISAYCDSEDGHVHAGFDLIVVKD